MGAKPEIDAVGGAVLGGIGDEPHGLLHDAVEELLVRARTRSLDSSVGGVHEDEIDVARVVQLPPAELAQRHGGDRGRTAVQPAGHAPLPGDVGHRGSHREIDHAVRDV